MAKPSMTIGLSEHRPEMIPLLTSAMQQHQVILLEEPADPSFNAMLAGTLDIEDYVQGIETEYPAFTWEMCHLLRKLKASGKQIIQVEPYLEILLGIHTYFADGNSPADLSRDSIQYPVYLAEKKATRALIFFYSKSMGASFEDTLEAVKQFARMDAARFRLRDSLRAQALVSLVENDRSAYIEAGVIHYPLWQHLHRKLGASVRLRLLFLADGANNVPSRTFRYGPGDKLTLLYMFHPTYSNAARENLLAARSLIYSKLIAKNELTEDLGSWPHLRDELKCIRLTHRLSLNDCRRLYFQIRHMDTQHAHQFVETVMSGNSRGS